MQYDILNVRENPDYLETAGEYFFQSGELIGVFMKMLFLFQVLYYHW